jgi:hypothetical protein
MNELPVWFSNKFQAVPRPCDSRDPEAPEYSFCEIVTAGANTPWHLRQLTEAGRKLGGGADTPGLCGREVSWDLSLPVRRFEIASGRIAPIVCKECRRVYLNTEEV